jgi:predicted NAD/FAD-dependent oxidoreductase
MNPDHPNSNSQADVLVLGAGAAGLTAAKFCRKAGLSVICLDKGRYPGGRMCTRSVGDARFDYGAQFFTARTPDSATWVEAAKSSQKLAEWTTSLSPREPQAQPRWVAAGGFQNLAQYLADGHVLTQTRAGSMESTGGHWLIHTTDQRTFVGRCLLITFPLPQALAFLDDHQLEPIPNELRAVYYHPCLALMCRTAQPPSWTGWLEPTGNAAHTIAFVGDNQHKGVSAVPALTVHCAPFFSAAHFTAPADAILRHAEAALGELLPPVLECEVMRWRFSQTVNPVAEPFWPILLHGKPPLALAGDGFGRSRIESAVCSGLAAARWLLTQLCYS